MLKKRVEMHVVKFDNDIREIIKKKALEVGMSNLIRYCHFKGKRIYNSQLTRYCNGSETHTMSPANIIWLLNLFGFEYNIELKKSSKKCLNTIQIREMGLALK